MEKKFTIQPSTGWEQYRLGTSHEWAIVALHERSGAVMVMSSYGSWSHIWTAPGVKGLKAFLTDTDIGYVHSKFCGPGDWWDRDATAKELKRFIIDRRRAGALSWGEARELWFVLQGEIDDAFDGRDFINRMEEWSEIATLDHDWWERLVYDIDPAFRHFWNELWVPFQAWLRNEPAADVAGRG